MVCTATDDEDDKKEEEEDGGKGKRGECGVSV